MNYWENLFKTFNNNQLLIGGIEEVLEEAWETTNSDPRVNDLPEHPPVKGVPF